MELIAKKPELVEVSDDDAEIMPPPAMPPAKTRKPRTKKQAAAPPSVSGTVKIKQEPADEVIPKRSTRSKAVKKTTATKASTQPEESESVAEEFEDIVPKVRNSSLANASTVSTETSVTTAQQQSASQPVTEPEKTRSKARTKSKKPVIDKVTKKVIPEPEAVAVPAKETPPTEEESPANDEPTAHQSDISTATEVEETEVSKGKTSKKKNELRKQSTESVYEDAKGDSKLFSAQVSVENIQKVNKNTFLLIIMLRMCF